MTSFDTPFSTASALAVEIREGDGMRTETTRRLERHAEAIGREVARGRTRPQPSRTKREIVAETELDLTGLRIHMRVFNTTLVELTIGDDGDQVEINLSLPPRGNTRNLVDPFRDDPLIVAGRITTAALSHLRRTGTHAVPSDRVDDERAHLERVASYVATDQPLRVAGGRLIDPETARQRANGPAEATTPWHPLTVYARDVWDQPGRDMLTPSQRRKWSREPLVEIVNRLPDDPDLDHPVVDLGPLTGKEPPEDVVHAMRLAGDLLRSDWIAERHRPHAASVAGGATRRRRAA